ncbi:MAG: ABC transporter substrate-binding protein, partial [Jatrophihabitans sp.]|uniref:ABC transporter substrate-binding protein n=1 Tax=Jatrophihabitans sp. TaxID=1932789 RepID=UPI003F7CFD49
MRRGRRVAVLAAATTAGLLLAACSSSGGSSGGSGSSGGGDCKASSGKVNLTFATWVPGMDKVVDLWNKANPDIQVTVKNVPAGNAGTYQNFSNGLKAGTAPDLGQVEYDTLPNFRLQGGLKNIAKCPGVSDAQSKFVDWTWSQVDFNGNDGVFAVPQDTGPLALFYRKDVFDKLGLTAPKTWDEYAADAAKIHQANPSQYITFFSQSDPNWYTGLLWQNGAQLFSDQGGKVKVSIAD